MFTRQINWQVITFSVLLCVSVATAAEDHGSAAEAKAMVQKTIATMKKMVLKIPSLTSISATDNTKRKIYT